MNRLNDLYEKNYRKKRIHKKNYQDLLREKEDMADKYEKEIFLLKQNLFADRKDVQTQTDIDFYKYTEIKKNSDLVIYHKKLVRIK